MGTEIHFFAVDRPLDGGNVHSVAVERPPERDRINSFVVDMIGILKKCCKRFKMTRSAYKGTLNDELQNRKGNHCGIRKMGMTAE